MIANTSILENLIPNQSDKLFNNVKEIIENEHKKTIIITISNEIEVKMEFKKEIVTGLLGEFPIEQPLWLTLTYDSTQKEKNMKVQERENMLQKEYDLIKKFQITNKNYFYSVNGPHDINRRTYVFLFNPACSYVLSENKELIDIQSYVFHFIGLKAA